MSKLAIGTAQFGNINYGIANKLNCSSISTSEVFEISNYAIGQGVNLMDTASTYGCSETLLGQFQLEPFQIVTKLPPIREEITEVSTSVERLIGNSLSKLRVNKLYGHHLYVLRINFKALNKSRARLMKELKNENIGCQFYYIPVPVQSYYRKQGSSMGDYPNALKYYDEALGIPLFYDLEILQQEHIFAVFKDLVG